MTNRYKPHLLVLPEDDANREIANGFSLKVPGRTMQILEVAGGWLHVLNLFEREHLTKMRQFSQCRLVLLVDFDCDSERQTEVLAKVPDDLRDRVFVLGTWSEPERLKGDLGSFETIGGKLAADCQNQTNTAWSHQLLQHNQDELVRLRQSVRSFLFPD